MTTTLDRPMSLLAEVTFRCPLQCPYCSNPLHLSRYQDELTTDEWLRVLGEAAALGVIQVHFSGGEPLLRKDLVEMVREARRLDLYSDLSTGATLATEDRFRKLKDAGLDAVQVSLLDSDPAQNDWVANAPSFEKKREAVLTARRLGFPVSLNVVLHRHNLERIEAIVELAVEWGVERLELAHVQYVGWALKNRAALLPSREQLERARKYVDTVREELKGKMYILHVLPDYYQDWPKACLAGWGTQFLTVAPDGAVLPCQAAREIDGLSFQNVRDASLEDIWFRGSAFERFRGTDWMPEPCQSCERKEIDFGGCRCQAFLLTGSAAVADPVCHLSPDHGLIEQALLEAEADPPSFAYRVVQHSD